MGPQGSWALVHRTTCTTCMAATGLTAKNRDQLRNPTLGNRVWATFPFLRYGPLGRGLGGSGRRRRVIGWSLLALSQSHEDCEDCKAWVKVCGNSWMITCKNVERKFIQFLVHVQLSCFFVCPFVVVRYCIFSRFCYHASSRLHAAFDFNSVDGMLIWTRPQMSWAESWDYESFIGLLQLRYEHDSSTLRARYNIPRGVMCFRAIMNMSILSRCCRML